MKYPCKFCSKDLKRSRPSMSCRSCYSKLTPNRYWLGKKRPDAVWQHLPHPRGKENIFSQVKFKGKDHARWKGNEVGYEALHTWVVRELGRPSRCEFCGKIEDRSRYIQWANKSREYKRELNDWIRLCAKCHYHYDRDLQYAT